MISSCFAAYVRSRAWPTRNASMRVNASYSGGLRQCNAGAHTLAIKGKRVNSKEGVGLVQGAVVEEVRPEPLWYREHHLPVWYVREQALLEPQTPQRQTLRVATRTEVAALAREREQYSCLHAPQRTRAKPCSRIPQARYFSTTSAMIGRQYPYTDYAVAALRADPR